MHLIKDHFSVTFEYHSQVEVKGQLHDILDFDMTLDVQITSHYQTLSHNVVHLALIEIQTHNISGDRY
jgi:hypothetical protein